MINYDLDVCIGRKKDDPGPLIKQHDSGITFTIHLIVFRYETSWLEERDQYSIPPGCTAVMKVMKPDGTFSATDAEIFGKSVVIAHLPAQATAAVGVCAAEVSIYGQDGKRVTTATFNYAVEEECVDDGAGTSEDYVDVMGDYIQDVKELSSHPPIPGDGGYWFVWDLERDEYVTSDLPLPDVSVGPAGKAATIKVGETITGDSDTPAKVENTGTENEAVLRFTIPRGAVGPTGATPAISVEVTGLPAGAKPTVSVSGTPEKPVISLGIPQGKQGDPGGKGDPGDPGQTPNITIGQVETLPAGSSVTASITGQTPNLVLNLGIPHGQQGDQGAGVPSTEGVPDNYVLTPIGWAAPTGGYTAGDLELVASATLEEAVDVISLELSKPCTEVIAVLTPYGDAGNSNNRITPYLYLSDAVIVDVNGLNGIAFAQMNLQSSGMVYDFRAAHWRLEGNLIYKASYKETSVPPTGVMAPGSYPWIVQANNFEITTIGSFKYFLLQLWDAALGAGTKLDVYGR
ncbi:Uncharacterised protein [uncultured Flavonifractor sp.]|nr:Uncharacterised protein [uncultured Flavonifractor sp.]